jgi:hypothetical protein
MVAIYRSEGRLGHSLRFVWHFLQMNIAMAIGMAAFAVVGMLFDPGHVLRSLPLLFAVGMAVAMVLPMAAWMRLGMRHGWWRTGEMSGAMVAPTLALVVICAVGLLPHYAAVVWSMPLMIVAMLADMVYRRYDYS